MAYNEKKAAANKRSDAKYQQLLIKPYIQEAETIRTAAGTAQQSVQAYILQAVRERMERESANKYYIGIPKAAADQAGERNGITGKEWLIETVKKALED
jgi:hypothetical protein